MAHSLLRVIVFEPYRIKYRKKRLKCRLNYTHIFFKKIPKIVEKATLL